MLKINIVDDLKKRNSSQCLFRILNKEMKDLYCEDVNW